MATKGLVAVTETMLTATDGNFMPETLKVSGIFLA